ncbi:3-hydroxyacyl-acyl-carrier-protein dehydratase FabZ [Porphyridium purpureum]|uniref:3-hydroxyacyl-acyl-carrier-protein dehydratase FabZ n=1 Tax=Porphyridium purpureum TaxID=35688 RepID=A0A5J4YMS9_PORPP|nr:3-hydroxyacyl-acyl-carrier-protein dehydratase FabZ [Porphyridium purpureum]|eukprot:POR3542..scf222_8
MAASFPTVRSLLRHREPLLFLDRIQAQNVGDWCLARSAACTNSESGWGRFDVLEMLGQCSALILAQMPKYKDSGVPVFAAMNWVRWKELDTVVPETKLDVYAKLDPTRSRTSMGTVRACAGSLKPEDFSEGSTGLIFDRGSWVCEAELVFAFVPSTHTTR